jgi:hypothetical protein
VLLPPHKRNTAYHYKIAAAFVAGNSSGALASALLFWFLAGFLAPLPKSLRVSMIVGGAAAVLLSWHGPPGGTFRLPENRRQIPAEVFGRGFVRGAYRFGLELGTGLRTYLPSPAPYLVLLLILLGRPAFGDTLLIALGWGLGRSVPLMVQLTAAGRTGATAAFMLGKARYGPLKASALVLSGMVSLVR